VLAVVERHFQTIERVCVHHTQYEELMEQVCLAFSYILGFSREYVPNSPVFVPMMQLMARCCEQHPQPFYMGLVRSAIGFFADAGSADLDKILIDLTGLFVLPLARLLGSSGGAPPAALTPPINAPLGVTRPPPPGRGEVVAASAAFVGLTHVGHMH
ncbi:unnamed protein product, partial [Prorocentrum cordatum]